MNLLPACRAGSRDELMLRAERSYARALALGGLRLEAILRYAIEQLVDHNNAGPILTFAELKTIPATIEDFVENPDFLGGIVAVWPHLLGDLKALNPDVLAGEEPVHEAFLGGATGIGKSTVARISILYQVYLLSCLQNPHRLYGLDPKTRFVIPLQSVAPEVTRRVLYDPLRETFEAMPYARRELTWNRRRRSALELEGGIHIVPLLANTETVLGQAIPGALLDEVNFMRIVERSKRAPGPRGLGGRFDQAEELYREVSQRRRSRFVSQAVSVGCIIACSSTRYQNDFLDRRSREVEEYGRRNVVVTRHKRYDVVPADRYCGETFSLLVGTERWRTRILAEDETLPADARVEQIPVEHRDEFQRDPEFALRAIVGVAVDAISPFIGEREKILEAIERGEAMGLEHLVDKPDALLARDGLPRWRPEVMPRDRDALRFVHIDLARTRDACGVAIVKYLGMTSDPPADASGTVELRPRFAVEAAISIKPSPDAELIFSDLRTWLMELVDIHRLDIYMVTFDGYQSADSRQILRRRGIWSDELSVDRTPQAYEYLRECLYDGRLAMVDSPTLTRELIQLERNPQTSVIDHPPRGSKDVADAVAGAIAAAVGSRPIRNAIGYRDRDAAPVRPARERQRPAGSPRRR